MIFILMSTNQIKFYFVTTTRIYYTCTIKTKKYCYVVVTWHIMCPLPVTPQHKLIKYRYMYTYKRNRCSQSNLLDNIIYFDNGLGNVYKKMIIFCKSRQFVFF